MKGRKIKKFDELSVDIEVEELDIDIDKLKEFEIESIIDIFQGPEKDQIKENIIGVPSSLTNKEVKRGDLIYITAMIRKPGQSFTSPATQAVIKLRVVDIYQGLSYLNKVINQ
jgi:hypothetical protein